MQKKPRHVVAALTSFKEMLATLQEFYSVVGMRSANGVECPICGKFTPEDATTQDVHFDGCSYETWVKQTRELEMVINETIS